MKKKIILIGATGNLGAEIYRQLKRKESEEKNLEVVPLVRRSAGLENERVCDFSDAALRENLKDAAVIINAAGSVKTYDKKEMEAANVELVKKIVSAAPKKAKIIHASSISVYGKKLAKKPADEQTPIMPDSDYARTKYEAEKILAQHANTVILRIGTIYSPARDYAIIVKKIAEGKMAVIGDGNNTIPFVHLEDAADAFIRAMDAKPGVYNIVGDKITQNEAYKIVAEELGASPPKKHVSFFVANLAAMIEEKISALTGRQPKITREHVAILYYDRPFDTSRAREGFGFKPRKNADGIREVVRAIIQKNL